ncbi:hypothetical protein EBQ90_07180 [bacterium]|nr:hypothetical protein [bacterium]
MEKTQPSYQFWPGNRWHWKAIQETYQDFFKQGVGFWTQHDYDIPFETTAKVFGGLIVIESILQGLINARFNFMARFFAHIGGLVGLGIMLGFIVLMKEWLQARGNFKEYLAFSAYAQFILLPISLIAGLSSQLGYFLTLIGTLWILYAFYKKFQLVLSRFLILVGIVWGIVFLAAVASLLAGMKLFV